MEDLRTIKLSNGTVLMIGDQFLICKDSEGVEVRLSVEKQRIIKALADHLNYPVTKEELYQAYTQGDNLYNSERVVGMIYNMPACIKANIVTERGVGYRLAGNWVQDAPNGQLPREQMTHGSGENIPLNRFSGDYYGFFLDPSGTGSVVGGYMHMDEANDEHPTELDVTAVLTVRSDKVLFSEAFSEAFHAETEQRYDRYEAFRKDLSENDRRCFWTKGKLNMINSTAELTLIATNNAKWTFFIEIDNYLKSNRQRKGPGHGSYRGGLGIFVAVSTQYNTCAGKIGIIHKDFCPKNLSLKNGQMQELLKLSEKDGRIPLRIDQREDNQWYSWFMSY